MPDEGSHPRIVSGVFTRWPSAHLARARLSAFSRQRCCRRAHSPPSRGSSARLPSVYKASAKANFNSVLYRIAVPENRADLQSKVIELAVVQIKSNNPQAGPPIFCLAGGPGGSSIELVPKVSSSIASCLNWATSSASTSAASANRRRPWCFQTLSTQFPTNRQGIPKRCCPSFDRHTKWPSRG